MSNHIRKAISWMYLNHGFYASVLMSGPIYMNREVKTAATDNESVWANPDFFAQFSIPECAFILAHEVEHIVGRDALRIGERIHKVWNRAADYRINDNLLVYGLPMPKRNGKPVGLHDHRFDGLAREQIYSRLIKDPPPRGGQGDGEGGGDELDLSGDLRPAPSQSQAEQSAQDARVRGRVIAAAAQTRARLGIGSIPAHLQAYIDAIGQPQVDWRQELRDFLTARARDDMSWSRLNRRVRHRGLRLPSMWSETCGPVAVVIDTSGSCHREIPQFLGELASIATDAQPAAIHVYFVDTQVQAYVETTAEDFESDIGDMIRKPPHGGGTDLRVGLDRVAGLDELDAVVVLTDMMSPWPDQFDYADRTLFVDTYGHYPAPFGRKVNLDADE